jgi:response regulator NasT
VKVLIAEDESIIRMDLRETLQKAGHMVVGEASDGEEAVTLARSLRPDAVLLDIRMPGTSGLVAAERISGERIAPCVILTAYHDRELVGKAARSGVFSFLVKPFQERELVAALELAVSRFGETRSLEEELEEAKGALETRKWIDRARGHLMDRYGVKEKEAFSLIRKRAMDTQKSIGEAAREILEHDEEKRS